MKTSKIILALLIVQIFCLFAPRSIFCQKESLGIFTYTPPKGWTKTEKEGATVYLDLNKTTNAFCLLTLYSDSPSAGIPETDFTNAWNDRVVKLFKGQENPKTESQTASEGWQGTVGGSEIEFGGGKAIALLTVFSGFGKTASVLVIVNDESYLAQMQRFIDGIKLTPPASSGEPAPI
jgi:hypothetical protein